MAPEISNELSGEGIINLGDFYVGGNLSIGNVRDKDNEALTALRVTDSAADKTRIEREKGQLRRDCYEWALSTDEYLQWLTGSHDQVLWIRGDAGKGKTMLLCGIINELERLPEPDSRCIAYFFCQAANAQLNSATNVIRGLLYGILVKSRQLVPILTKRLEHAGQGFFGHSNAWDSLSQVLLQVLNDPGLPLHTYLVVDGLDECSANLEELLNLFTEITALSKVKVLVSSRNWPEVTDGLAGITELKSLSLELNETHVSQAVALYIDFKVKELSEKKKYSAELRQMVHQHLKKNSNSTFLWVALVCQELGKNTLRNFMVEKRLKAFPPGLKHFYKRMMAEILDSEYQHYCQQLLEAVAVTYRPLFKSELASLVESPEDFSADGCLDDVIELCRSMIVSYPDNSVTFVHQSAKDFLIESQSFEGYPSISSKQHVVIVLRSLAIMSRTLKRNIYELPHPGAPVQSPPGPEDPLDSCRYSCVSWASHLLEIITAQDHEHEKTLVQDGGPVHVFLKGHFLHWLESLALLKSVGAGLSALARLSHEIARSQETLHAQRTARLIANATRLGQSHRDGIEQAPLQVYMSAYAFIPSTAREELFGEESPPQASWIRPIPVLSDEGWPSCLMGIKPLLESPGATNFSSNEYLISPDGRWLASTIQYHFGEKESPQQNGPERRSSGKGSHSSQTSIKLWDITTGNCMGTIDHDSKFITFSWDGQYLASIGVDSVIRVWHVITRSCVSVLNDHTASSVIVIAFSEHSEGLELVSVSADNEIRHWNWKSQICERRQTLDRDRPLSVHGNWRAYLTPWSDEDEDDFEGDLKGDFEGDFDGNFEGDIEGSFEGDPDPDWNPDANFGVDDDADLAVIFDRGERIAILNRPSQELGVWRCLTGECEWILDIRSSRGTRANIIAGATQGRSFAAGFTCGMIRLWNTPTRDESHLVQGHEDEGLIMSMDFNQDGTRLVTVSKALNVKMWNVQTAACEMAASGWRGRVSSIEPLIMVVENDNDFQVWDVSDPVDGQVLDEPAHVARVTLSSDGTRAIAILSSNSELDARNSHIRLWDVNTGKCLTRIGFAFAEPGYIEEHDFSQDLKLAAVYIRRMDKSHEGIRIYDTDRGFLKCTIPFPTEARLISLTFSPCGHVMAVVRLVKDLGCKLSLWTTSSGQCLSDQIVCPGISTEIPYGIHIALVCSAQKSWAALLNSIGTEPHSNRAMLDSSVASRFSGELHHTRNVSTAAFTSDWLMLATGCDDGTVKLWDTVTGYCIGAFNLGTEIYGRHDLLFSGSNLELHADRGIIDLGCRITSFGTSKPENRNLLGMIRGYGHLEDDDWAWITRDGKRFLWLPQAYRPNSNYAFTIKGATMVVDRIPGKMFFCRLPGVA